MISMLLKKNDHTNFDEKTNGARIAPESRPIVAGTRLNTVYMPLNPFLQ